MSEEHEIVLKEAESGRIKIVVVEQKRLMFNCHNESFHMEKLVALKRAHVIYAIPDTFCGRDHEQYLWLSIKDLLDLEDALDRLDELGNQPEAMENGVECGKIKVYITRDEYKLRTAIGYTGYEERMVPVECAHIHYSIECHSGRVSYQQNMMMNAEELADLKSAIEQLGLREEDSSL
jgi:hypothetical protein